MKSRVCVSLMEMSTQIHTQIPLRNKQTHKTQMSKHVTDELREMKFYDAEMHTIFKLIIRNIFIFTNRNSSVCPKLQSK